MYLELLLSRAAPDWKQIIRATAKGGHSHVFRWLITKRSDGRGPWQRDFEYVFHEQAAHGHLEILQWLHPRLDVDLTGYVMERAARNGHLDVVKWLYDKGVGNDSKNAVKIAAQNGQLEMVQWLHKHLPNTCLVFFGSNEMKNKKEKCKLEPKRNEFQCLGAMDGAASGGHVEVVKWLHQTARLAAPMWQRGGLQAMCI